MQLDTSVSAIVTGGASGLGEATARALAAKGVKVALFDFNEETGEKVAADIGGLFCKVDVTDEASVDAGFAKARAAHGQERILVNCAGTGNVIKTASRDKATGETKAFPTDQFERIIQINLIGTFRCCAKSARGMLDLSPLEDGARGVIINTGSVAAEDGQIGQAAYAASKGGIVSLTLPMARDLMNDGIRVNCILPGIFDTPLMARAADAVKQSLAASVPFPKRFGRPPEFAAMALAMIENDYWNGEDVRLDGGIRMAPR
ncbi:MAG: 3-hydroxy-2-methylbutyryl-CoA dehydrogenase [Novosphingobium sp. 63-713]|uniref:SDR family NAD(P)-dependent oxidoreductase n=1 Tax=unclassified Novosphingobium TaxID=2644732 RepID=UPI00086E8CEE|nr:MULTISPECIES: SDR family NAD(P)-dependent oxidoreductase [unclassified Novosphingobium]MBN9145145.1 SDR family NAD(P)-dependent oxidoreductase [Novosphingobium sp.]MDR6709066.1 NAD(P)-dependent dehydrogenase (short-subunit alcohol dehydrogenase family) [Novosphingobium sp. 1748]ODU70908.1 MAG: 3-hydroxy-2-methylbutyryl-CoA dehydrogenase [Novosphingobium sp. SCN 66-18]OJX89860.1 MAG: 3-hydroxy-2-methylbutyryl-CoA dehydrogenase [Novosphingobium sp. 63-713]